MTIISKLKTIFHKENYVNLKYPEVKYLSDKLTSNPFDLTGDDLFFFYDDNYSNLSDKLEDLFEFHNVSHAWVVFHEQRMDIIDHGKVLKHFDSDKRLKYETVNGKEIYCLHSSSEYEFYMSNIDKYWKCYNIKNPKRKNNYDFYSNIWTDYEDCLSLGKKFTKEFETSLLLTKIVESFDRH